MRRIRRRRLERLANDLGDLVIADLARRAGTGLVIKTRHPMFGEPAPPFSNRVGGCAQPQADVLVCHPCRRVQDDARPLRQPLRGLAPRRKALKFAPLAVGQIDPTAVLPIAIPRANARRELYIFVDQGR